MHVTLYLRIGKCNYNPILNQFNKIQNFNKILCVFSYQIHFTRKTSTLNISNIKFTINTDKDIPMYVNVQISNLFIIMIFDRNSIFFMKKMLYFIVIFVLYMLHIHNYDNFCKKNKGYFLFN